MLFTTPGVTRVRVAARGLRDEKGQRRVRSANAQPPVLVVGELNVDLVATGLRQLPKLGHEIEVDDFEMVLGSASAIFASGVAHLGHPVRFIGKIGDDDFGHFCLSELQRLGVDCQGVLQESSVRTGATICLSMPKDRALVTFPGAIASLRASELPRDVFKGSRHLHMTSFSLQKALRPSFGKLFASARRAGLTTSFDPNSNLEGKTGADVKRLLRHVDVLFLNQLEARQLTGLSPRKAAVELSKHVRYAVVKLGSKGAVLSRQGQLWNETPHSVKAVDTTGAGDSFAAGFVSALTGGMPDEVCLKVGNLCGALSTRAVGGTSAQAEARDIGKLLGRRYSAVPTRSQHRSKGSGR